MRFKVLTAASMKATFVWDVAQKMTCQECLMLPPSETARRSIAVFTLLVMRT